MLSSQPLSLAAAAAADLTLRLVDDVGTPTLELVDNASESHVLARQALVDTSAVDFAGSDDDDRFVIDDSVPVDLSVTFAGRHGLDKLLGRLADSVWRITGRDAGQVDSVVFDEVEYLFGGAGADTFVVTAGASLSGLLDAGAGSDTLVGGDSDNVWTLSGADAGILGDLSFRGVENVTGGAGADTFTMTAEASLSGVLAGGAGSDTLVGADTENTWTISGANAGTLNELSFSGIENLTGGAGQDTFVFVAGGSLDGVLAGGLGMDTLRGADTPNTWRLTGTDAGTLNGRTFVDIENLVGGAASDRFVFAGGSVSGRIDGGAGDNVFDYSAQATEVSVDLATGAATATGGIASVSSVIGGAGSDTLVGPASSTTWTVTGVDTGTVGSISFSGVENLAGGTLADTFVFLADGSLGGLVSGSLGDDTLVGPDRANTWEVTDQDAGRVNGTAFAGVESLLGGAVEDAFVFGMVGRVTGLIDGRAGRDRVRGADKRNRWKLTGSGTAKLDDTSLAGVEQLEGGGDQDELVGPDADTTWSVTGPDAGDVAGVSFSGMENLTGAADNEDTFVVENGGSVSLLEGGSGGFDTIVIGEGDYSEKIYTATGPNSGSISLDGTVIQYSGFEPLADLDAGANVIYEVGSAGDQIELRLVSGQDFILDSLNGTFEDATFTDPGAGGTVTIRLQGGADTITLKNLDTLDASLTVEGGTEDDTIKLDDNWGAVTLVEAGGAGNDTLDFGEFGGGAITITPGVSQLTIADAATGTNTVAIANANVSNFESLVNADIDLTGSLASVKTELVAGLERMVAFVRNLAASGDFLTDLPVIGKNADVTISKALDFAEALDEIRFQIEEYFDGLGSLTTQDLIDFLDGKFQAGVDYVGPLKHLGAAIFAAKPITTTAAGDEYDFKLTVDGVVYHVKAIEGGGAPSFDEPTKTVTVGFTAGSVDVLLAAINAAISTVDALAGQIGVQARDGRLAFQVVGTEIDEFKLAAGNAADEAFSKLGLETTDTVLSNVQEILNRLGDLNVSLAAGVTLAVSFEGGVPKLRFDVNYRADRTSEFFFNFGPEAQSLGLAFDIQAQISAMAELVADFQLGLGLQDATTADFFLDVDALRAGISLTASAVTDVALNIGFIGLEANGTLALDAGLSVNTATLQNVTDPSSINVGSLGLTPTGGADGLGSPNFDIDLTLTVDAGTSDIGFVATGTLTAGGDPFDGSSITLDTDVNFDAKFPDFNNLNAAGVVSLLGQLSTWLDGVRQSDAISSLNIPFVEGGLQKILDLGEVLSDALLFDEGPDDLRDGGDKLVTDLNKQIGDAKLGRLIRAQGNGSSIDLVAIDPGISAFSIAVGPGDAGGFAQLGFSAGDAGGSVLTRSGAAVPSVVGQITSKAVIHFSVTRNGEIALADVTLEPAATSDNKGIGDDKPKLLDAGNAPTFANAQEFADRLSQIITLGQVHYDVATKILTFKIEFDDVKLFSVELPVDFKLDLGSIANVQSNTHLIIDATGGLNLTLGFDLSETPAGSSALTDGTTLANDSDPLTVDVKKEEAITADAAPRTIVGQLSGDANFTITYNPTVDLTVPKLIGQPGTDINVTKEAGDQSETAIVAANPVDPDNIIIGANNLNSATSDFVWVTHNGGANWIRVLIPVPAGGTGNSTGDPALAFSRDGKVVVYTHMIAKDGTRNAIATALSKDGGDTWLLADTRVIGSVALDDDGDGFNDNNDKNYIAVGPRDASHLNEDRFVVTWQRHNVIYASTSLDGLAWTAPVVVGGLLAGSSTAAPSGSSIDAIPSFGPNGEIYVVWEDFGDSNDGASRIKFDSSLDGGVTWGGGHDAKVVFDTAESALTPDDEAILDTFASVLNANPLLIATIAGYTDTVGTPGDNQTLSDSRATSVFNYLTVTKGIAASRLTKLGFGESHLAVATGQEVGNQQNRRVELSLDEVVYTGYVNVFRDPFGGGSGLDGVDETTSPAGLGEYEIPGQDTRGIWMGLSMDVDLSGSVHEGRIYVAFTDQGDLDGNADALNATDHHNTDIFVIASDDKGATWTALAASPEAVGADQVRVNDDFGTASQWFSWLDVDQSTGAVAISWYDTRNDLGAVSGADTDALTNTGAQYFAAVSRDFGLTWDTNLQVSGGTSNVSAAVAGAGTAANQFGDYTGLAFANSTIYMTWADNSNSTGDHVPLGSKSTEVYYDKIPLINSTIDDLLADINAVIADAPLLAGKFQAQADGNTVKIVAIDPSITSFTVTVPSNSDPAFRDLGFQLSADATLKDGDLFVEGAKNAPTLVGQLTADATFDMTLDGVTKTITVKRADTVSSAGSNHNILDLVSDVQKAINNATTGFGPDKIKVSSAGGKLLFTRLAPPAPALGSTDSFTIAPGTNAAELGITSTLTSDEADLVITTSDGVKHRVTLDNAATIADVIAAINTQTGGSVTASKTVDDPQDADQDGFPDPTPVNEANTGLTLVDNTFPGGTPFIVAAANGSQAGVQLGIIGMDDSPVNPDDVADGKIVGGTIAGATLLDRFFITSDDLSSVIDASVSVSAGVKLSNIKIDAEAAGKTTIFANGFDFTTLDAAAVAAGDLKIEIKDVAGFTPGLYTITDKIDATHVKVAGVVLGEPTQQGGAGILRNGVHAAANFGFIGISLDGSADVGAKLTLGFDTNAPELADSKLTLQELVNAVKDGQVLDLLAIPDLVPISPATNFGEVDLKLGLTAGGGDLTGLATTLFGAGDPRVEITLVTFGDPFIGTRFDRANYDQTSATTFVVDGNFTTKLPDGVTLRFTEVASGESHEVVVSDTSFASGKTTVTVSADAADPFALPVEADFDDFSVSLLPKLDIQTPDLGDLPDLSDLSFADIIAALQALSNFLGQFESFGFLNTDLPIINKSVNDLLAFADDFAQALEEAKNNPAGSLQVLEAKINEAIGISSAKLAEVFAGVGEAPVPGLTDDAFDLSYDVANDLLKVDFSLGASFSRGLDMAIPGIDFGGALAELGLGNLLDLSGSAGLKAEGAVLLRLSLAIDVANFDIEHLLDHIYILDTTGLDAKLTVGGEDIAFRVGVGPFALSIASADGEQSKITIAADADAGLKASAFTGGKAALSSIDGSDFQAGATGTVTGTLPVFFPNDSTRLGTIKIGGSDGVGAFTPIGDLADLLDGGFAIKTQAGPVTPDAIVVDVSDVVAGISGFNFDNFNIFDNIFLAIDGLDVTLGFIQDVVGDKIGSLTIPLIGDGLNKAAHFIGDLREDVIGPLRAGIEKAKDAAQDFANPDKNIISKLLFDLLGPSGADLLQDRNWDGIDDGSVGDFIDLNTNLDDFLFNPNTTLELEDVFIEWDLALGDTLVNESADIGFDLGIPGLGLKTEGDINLDVEWLLNLGFGLSFKEGFYVKVDDPHELLFDVSVDLSPGTAITGTLGFLGLRAEDKEIDGHATELGATFMVDIFEQGASGDDATRLGFTEFGQIGFNAGVAAEASASLGLELGLSPELFSEIFGAGAGDVISGFPKIVGDFVFLWEIGTRGSGATLAQRADSSTFVSFAGIGDAIEDGLKKVAFQDVSLDVGSFLSDVLGPIVEEVGKFTGPIQPLIDFITSPIPIIGQLGLDITWLDLAASLGGFDAGFIESVAEIITLINQIADLSNAGAVMLPIGDMTIFDESAGFEPHLWEGGLDLGDTFEDIKGVAGLLNDVIGALPGGIGEALGDLGGEAAEVLGGVVGGEAAGGFAFPFLEDPSEIFGLLMGKPARLVTYDLAPLDFNFDFHVFFPIFGPLGVSIGLLVDFHLDTAFGYDTQGIQDFVEGGFRNPTSLFNGFYIDDSPLQNGVDDPELTFLAELQAAAELNLGIARAGVAAALGFTIEFDLFDPNKDGRIRIAELLFNIENQLNAPSDAEKLLAPLAIFDVHGEIFARMFVFLEIDFGFFSFEKEFPIFGPVTLLSFDVDFFRPPILAGELENGDLLIHTGEFAKQRLLGNATDVAENLIIQSDGTDGDFVKVKIKAGDGALGDDADVFQDYLVRKGGKIVIDGGEGDDIYDLTGFTEDGVLVDIELGVGNDKVLWGNAAGGVAGKFSTVKGGSGDDEITGGGGSDLIFGEAGNDTINAGAGDDLVFGDEGEIGANTARGLIKATDGGDTIDAGGGQDIAFGGGGKDVVKGGTGADPDLLIGGGGLVTFNSPTIFSNVKPLEQDGVTETENLTFDTTAGDTIEGGDGADLLFGTAGPDTIKGEGGDDTIFGQAGFDTIDAGGGDDIVFGDGGKITAAGPVPFAGGDADNIQGGAGLDTIFAGGGGDFIQGGADDDRIFGGSGPDFIFGDNGHVTGGVAILDAGTGNDKIFGEGEPDKMYGGPGIDEMDGGAGPDQLYGGADADVLTTNKGSDFLDGGQGSDGYLIFFQGGFAASFVQVKDSGSTVDTDLFVATGTFFDDEILLRSNTDGSVAFVAMINDPAHVERIEYNFSVERIVVNGSFGNDYFASDDTAAEITLNGEFGDDVFQIGQMFKSERTVVDANVSVNDVFATIETTRGFLSNGISKPMTINGGVGNDLFTVYHNKAVLQLNGEEGDDVFEIRAFALAGSQEPQRARTDISGGAGADLVQYAVNAPVNIDGGDGFDTVVIIGTEFGDDFVITDKGVFGAGLNVNFVNIESLRVDGAEGDDRFFVQSTSEKFVTEIFGGLGADTFNMSGATPPVVSNDLRGHSGVITHDVESTDARFDGQQLFGVSANVADNDEPFAVIQTTGGSTIITEGGTLVDSYTIVLTRKPDTDIFIKALAPIPTPTSRERRALSFSLGSPTQFALTADGTGLTLKFTTANWYVPQTVNVFADATALTDLFGLFTRRELGDDAADPGDLVPGVPFDMDDDAREGVRFGVINHLVQAASVILEGTLSAVTNGTGIPPTPTTATITDPGTPGLADKLVGRKLFISEGKGLGEVRTILGTVDNGGTITLTLDRPFVVGNVPDTASKYFSSIDDAIVGKMTSFEEDAFVGTDPDDHRSTFTDTSASFPTAGEGLTGAILEIIGGPGAGQQRLILSNNDSGDPSHKLILNGPWRTNPVAGQSIYRIQRYDGLAIPSVTVQINDDDLAGVIVDESRKVVDPDVIPDASDVVLDSNTITAVIEGGDGDFGGEIDALRVQLSHDPGGTVTVALMYDHAQLELTDLSGGALDELIFNSLNWSTFQPVLVHAIADGVREGFHSSLIQFDVTLGSDDVTLPQTDTFLTIAADKPVPFVGLSQAPVAGSVAVILNGDVLTEAVEVGGVLVGDYYVVSNKVVFIDGAGDLRPVSGDISVSYNYVKPGFETAFTAPVLARISDADAPTVLVRESAGSTDVIEVKSSNDGAPDSIPVAQDTNQAPWTDTYEVVLTGAPTDTVSVTLTPAITKTTRTGGIRHDAIQVAISSVDSRVTVLPGGNLEATFTAANWDEPILITVKAVDDAVVDGGDTQVFAPHPDTVSGILGPLVVAGAGGRGTLAFNAPLMLPGETNRRTVDGNVVAFTAFDGPPAEGPGAVEEMTVELADLEAKRVALGFDSIDDLIGLTIEMSRGQGTDVLLDPSRPRERFDRFWQITAIEGSGVNRVLTLQNPSQLDVSQLPASAIPSPVDDPDTSEVDPGQYAITALSANFFVDETTQVDVMFVHDEDSPADSSGLLTANRLSGLNMGPDLVIGGQLKLGGITYAELEVLEINLGSGNNNFTVLGTPTRADGYQTWTFLNTGDDIIWNGVQGDTVAVTLNAAEEVTAAGIVSSAQNPNGTTIFQTTVTVPGPFADGALAGQVIKIVEDGLGENNAEADNQTRRILGNVGGVLTVDRPWEFIPNGEAFEIVNEADGAFAVNTQGGNDTVNASASSLGIVMFGGLGTDTLTGGSGDDIIFGDRGRVDYFDEIGAIVTRLGDAPEPITGFVTSQVVDGTPGAGETDLLHIEDTGPKLSGGVPIGGFFPVPDTDGDPAAGTEDIGLRGLYVDINNGFGFLQTIKLIDTNTGTILTLAGPFDIEEDLPGPVPGDPAEYRISTIPEDQTDGVVRAPTLLITVDSDLGDTDTINAGGGNDQIFGGAGDDDISAGADDDVVVGDAGRIDRSRDPDAPAEPGFGDAVGSFLDLVRTIAFAEGDDDTINGDAGDDILVGGTEDDTMDGGVGVDILLGDQGTVDFQDGLIVSVKDPGTDGDDTLTGGADPDLVIGGLGNDTISGSGQADILIGDAAEVLYAPDGIAIDQITTVDRDEGGTDTIYGGSEDDIVIGGANSDNLDGGADRDLIFGDNLLLVRHTGSGDAIDPRFRALTGTTIYGPDGLAQVSGQFAAGIQPVPGGRPTWADWTMTLDQTLIAAQFGDDYIAGGGGDDEIFGQLGDDVIQGDGTIGPVSGIGPMTFALAAGGTFILTAPTGYGAIRSGGVLDVTPSFEGATDGDDYIEGNGGHDVIFGNLGQDDIIGGSSSLFSLETAALRPDAGDLIFGGAGTDISRNNLGDASLNGAGDAIITTPTGHARDADMILGDNGNIYRLVSVNGTTSYRTFNYDTYGALKIIPRAAELLDYTPGGILGAAPAADLGAADELHGESGDDAIYGQKGDDVLFGEGQDDDLIGGYGNDWISGGTGDDGVLGDDGRIYTSRNGSAEPLYGILAVPVGQTLNQLITTPGQVQQATINVAGELKKTVNLTPFSVDPLWGGTADEFDGEPVPHNSDDIVYGGWGNDWLHGGSGDDAMSGAEALAAFYGDPANPGDVLGYGDVKGGEFAAYDEFDPLRKIAGFLLNFDAAGEGPKVGTVNGKDFFSDGNDRIFGDLGNDWLVGGTGRDDLYGGWGDDLMNADDDHDSTVGTGDPTANNIPDTHATYEDRAYGGAGRDVLIGNTGGDRLIDWVGEFNSYLVPFAPFGMGTVSRTLQPQLAEFLYALSASDGADPTRTADVGASADPARNGEPFGELGAVRQQDFAWQAQTGAPDDPQAGNIPGGKRDVLRSATFETASATGFFTDSGVWTVSSGVLQVAAQSLGSDAVSVFHVGDALPTYFEVQASIMTVKPTAGWEANSYVIFDYQGKDDFKFAGLDVSLNKAVVGHRDASGWHVDQQAAVQGGVKADKYYNMLVAANGVNVIVVVDNKQLITHTYQPRIVDGYSYGLNWGMVGVGSDNSRGAYDNIRVQILPPQITLDYTENFDDGAANLFGGELGMWQVQTLGANGRYVGTPTAGTTKALSLLDLGLEEGLRTSSYLELSTRMRTQTVAGLVFDQYGPDDFKFVAIDAQTGNVVIGHSTAKRGWAIDASVAKGILAGTDYDLGVALKGSTVSVSLNGQVVLGYAFNAVTVDGDFGLLGRSGSSSFESVRLKTDDPAFTNTTVMLQAEAPASASGTALALSEAGLAPIAAQAIELWSQTVGAADPRLASLDTVSFAVADLPGATLGMALDDRVYIDVTAAGYGWYVGGFVSHGRMDLFTVVTHELGHVLGFEHTDSSGDDLMEATLAPGVRRLEDDPLPAQAPEAQPEWATIGTNGTRSRGFQDIAAVGTDTWRMLDAPSRRDGVRPMIDWDAEVGLLSGLSPYGEGRAKSALKPLFPAFEDAGSEAEAQDTALLPPAGWEWQVEVGVASGTVDGSEGEAVL